MTNEERKDAIAKLNTVAHYGLDLEQSDLVDDVIGLLEREQVSVLPTREHGEWIETGETILTFMGKLLFECQCSKCNGLAYFRKESLEHKLVGADWCPCCGADMRGEQNNV